MSMSAVDDKAAVVAVESAAGELRREFFSDEVLDRLLGATISVEHHPAREIPA